MEAKLQRRVQRYGWDLAATAYEPLWRGPLEPAQAALLALARLAPGERVLDVACGTGLLSLPAAAAVGPLGRVVGIDLSAGMVAEARACALAQAIDAPLRFERMDAEAITLDEQGFDVALCALGLMYMPDPEQAVREMRRLLRPGGRLLLLVWGEAARCAWSSVFRIIDEEIAGDVCPLFFRLAAPGALRRCCAEAGFEAATEHRLATTMHHASADEACDAALVGGPVALAWSRFDADARRRVRLRYLESIEPWRRGARYALPASFVIAEARAAGRPGADQPRT
jgi:ubiquinone/menaquinone biosynthesis C-methylase UbiE